MHTYDHAVFIEAVSGEFCACGLIRKPECRQLDARVYIFKETAADVFPRFAVSLGHAADNFRFVPAVRLDQLIIVVPFDIQHDPGIYQQKKDRDDDRCDQPPYRFYHVISLHSLNSHSFQRCRIYFRAISSNDILSQYPLCIYTCFLVCKRSPPLYHARRAPSILTVMC